MVTKNYKPRHTHSSHASIREDVKRHKRRARRAAKQALRSGDVRDWNRAEKKLTNWDFE